MKIPQASEIPGLIQHLSYAGIFVWFLVTQLIVIMPIPEEVVLISIGYVSATGVWNPLAAAAIAFGTLLLVDGLFYALSLSGNRYVKRLAERSAGGTFARAESQMKRNMVRAVFTLTFIPRLRFFGPVLAGILKLKWYAFSLADASALAIYVCLYATVGYVFHTSIAALFKKAEVVHHLVFIAAVVVIGIIVGRHARGRWGRARTQP